MEKGWWKVSEVGMRKSATEAWQTERKKKNGIRDEYEGNERQERLAKQRVGNVRQRQILLRP